MSAPRVLVNLRFLLSTRVVSNSGSPENGWHDRTRAKFGSLYNFLQENSLLTRVLALESIDDLVITSEDLTDSGLKLWKSGAIYRWLGSFDKNPSKSPSDVRMLAKALAAQASS